MESKACVIITSISGHDNPVLQHYAQSCGLNKMDFIMAGDVSSPADLHLPGCEFLSLATQKQLPFKLAKLLPDKNYAKKNLAYLQAIKHGHQVLVETDDDNIPLQDFWNSRNVRLSGAFANTGSWLNVYSYFSDHHVWPRGFALDQIQRAFCEPTGTANALFCPIQQGLADENPDVDAIFRLSGKLPVYFKKKEPLILGSGTICPFNSQNTTWFKEAFPLLYLPSCCSFRMTDIWRGLIAQRILWSCGWYLAFHQATVFQERNEHNLLKDLEQEIAGYLNNGFIMEQLCQLDLKPGEANIADNMMTCYRWFVENKLIDQKELAMLAAWLDDLATLA